jgi:hypothetical protein
MAFADRVTTLSFSIADEDPRHNHIEIYPNQTEPQGAYISLDLSTGAMWYATNPEIGDAVPVDVWHGLVRRYHLPAQISTASTNALMQEVAHHAQTVLDHAEVVWDGSNNVVKDSCKGEWECDCPMVAAERAIEAAINTLHEDDYIMWYEAADWYEYSVPRGVDEYVARVKAGETVEAVAAAMEQEIIDECGYTVIGIEEYLKCGVEAAEEKEED